MRSLAIAVLFVFVGVASADEKKPTGKWSKEADGFVLKFNFKKDDVMVFSMGNGNDTCEMETKCTHEKDSIVKCEVKKYTKNGNLPDVKEGFKFSFKFAVKDKKATISDIEAENVNDDAKKLVEGDYEKAAD